LHTLRPAKLVIVDQTLRDYNGHHCELDHAVAQAAEAIGIRPIVAANRRCDTQIAALFPELRRYFTCSWVEAHLGRRNQFIAQVLAFLPPSTRAVALLAGSAAKRLTRRGPQRNIKPQSLPSFGAELADLVVKEHLEPSDHVLIHSLSVAELHALIEALSRSSVLPMFHIVLRRDADEIAVKDDAWGGIRGVFSSLHGDERLRARLRFYSDTHHLCRQYEAISASLTVQLLPIPHGLSDQAASMPRRAQGDPVCVTYLGNARTEKGFHYLPDVVDKLRASHIETGRLRFVLQANANIGMEEAIITSARRRLARYPIHQVELLLRPLTIPEFQRYLLRSDIVLLPYQAEPYRRRSSGILVQALVCGRPVIVPRHTWLADEAPSAAAIVYDDPTHLPRAILDASDRIEELRAAACEAAPEWRRFHNADNLLRTLIDQQGSQDCPVRRRLTNGCG
jgi:glycosyltransferase involved in cell wall biosynthesis